MRDALTQSGYTVQTLRLASPPPSEMERPVPPKERPELARRLEAECFLHGIDYASVGPALPDEPDGYAVIPEVLAAAENVFTSGMIADPEIGLSLSAVQACARVIRGVSTVSADGFANLRFAALANVPPGCAFFPAAYHRGGPAAVALATESADLALDAVGDATSATVVRHRLVTAVEGTATALTRIAEPIAAEANVRFLGIDFSLAPHPDQRSSLGASLEAFGVPAVGLAGSAAAAAFLSDCLDRAQFQRTGFCGLFLPVLEDSTLAARAAQGQLTVTDLLLYSLQCGTGLDIIPLPGDVPAEALVGVLIDVGALALRHDKPLTARLMPIPGKAAGDEIHFDFPYFAEGRVMALQAAPLHGLFAGKGVIDIGPR